MFTFYVRPHPMDVRPRPFHVQPHPIWALFGTMSMARMSDGEALARFMEGRGPKAPPPASKQVVENLPQLKVDAKGP